MWLDWKSINIKNKNFENALRKLSMIFGKIYTPYEKNMQYTCFKIKP